MFTWLRLLLPLALVIAWLAPASAQGLLSEEEDQWLMSKGAIRVGIEPDRPPLSFVDQEGKPQGILVDFWKELALRVGFPLEFTAVRLSLLMEMMQKKKLDSLGGMEPGEDARELLGFTGLFAQAQSHILTTPSRAGAISGWAQAGGLVLGTVEGSWEQLLALKAGIKSRAFAHAQEAVAALLAGRVEALVMQDWQAAYYLRLLGRPGGAVPAGRPVGALGLALPVRRGESRLLDILNKGIMLVPEERLQAIVDKWTRPAGVGPNGRGWD